MDIFYRTRAPASADIGTHVSALIQDDDDVPDLAFNGSPWRPGASWSVIASRRAVPDPKGNSYTIFLVDVSTTYTIITGVPTAPSLPYAYASTSSTPNLAIFTWTSPS